MLSTPSSPTRFHPNIAEGSIVRAWERQSFDPEGLRQLGLSVVYRGLPSDAGGPDFQDAVLARADGTLLQGDVEFHVRAGDWYVHGHNRNPAYNRVILHVVWAADGQRTVRADGVEIPVLELEGSLAFEQLDGASHAPLLMPHPCVPHYARMSTASLLDCVRAMGMQRFSQRAAVLASDLTCMDRNQVAYVALLRSLGYASNVTAFTALAEAAPYGWIMSVPAVEREASLLYAAGFGPPASAPPPTRLCLEDWRLARLRPANHPYRRLLGLNALLSRMSPDLASGLVDAVAGADTPAELRRSLTVEGDGGAYIGPGRADEIAVSAVLPLVAALDPDSRDAEALYGRYPSPPANRWTRHMLALFREAGHGGLRPIGAVEHQGLHHLYHTHCRPETRSGCPVCRPGRGRVPA